MHEPKSGACESNLSILSQSGLNHKVEAVGGVLAEECKKTWDSFAFNREKNNKK
jgi:tRNA(Arg) A34 adenosine deaminase TadA